MIINIGSVKEKGISFLNSVKFLTSRAHQTLIANTFNDMYINMVDNLMQNKKGTDYSRSLTTPIVHNTLFLYQVTENELRRIIQKMKNKHSSGDDEFSNHLLKACKEELITIMTHIINCSLMEGTFPDMLKIVKVVPIFKKGDMQDPYNYRPVSLISCFSKLFESLMLNRLVHFFDKHNILIDEQHGFRKNKSTETAIEELIDNLTQSLDNKRMTVAMFMDMTKAFDTIQFQTLVQKLEHYGIRGHALDWLKSYLTDRWQYVQINNVYKSHTKKIKHGIPQGSVLGPLLFNIFINDIKTVSTGQSLILYADDTTAIINDPNAQKLEIQAYIMSNTIAQWLEMNNLFVNIDKTKFMHFSNRRTEDQVDVIIDETRLEEVSIFKFLGITIDNKLNWGEHINNVCNKLRSIIFIMKQMSQYSSRELLLNIYFGLFESFLRYGISVWGNSNITNTNRILKLQKKAIRLIVNIKQSQSCKKYFKALGILTFPSIYIYKTILSIIRKQETLQTNQSIHNHNTRHKKEFRSISHNLVCYEKGPTYSGVKLFHKLPVDLQKLKENTILSTKLKQYLLEKSFYTVAEYMLQDYEIPMDMQI